MEFVLFPPIELPDFVSIPALVKIDHWDPRCVVVLEDKGIDYIKCSLSLNGQVAAENLLFFVSPVIPLAPILDTDIKAGISGTLSFHKSLHPIITDPAASLEFLLNVPSEQQPPVVPEAPAEVDHLAQTDPILDLCADLEKYARGGFTTFSEFKARIANIRFIDANQYENIFEEAIGALFKVLRDESHKKFANLLVREIKGVMK